MSLENNITHYISVHAVSSAGSTSDTISSDGVMIDNIKPVINSIAEFRESGPDDADWLNNDPNSHIVVVATDNGTIKKYEFSIGTSKGSDDAVNWFDSDSSAGEINVTSLVENTQYYSNARVTDAADNISDVVSSDGFKMDYTGPPVHCSQ